jgi:hypothetical protein
VTKLHTVGIVLSVLLQSWPWASSLFFLASFD